MFLFRCKLSDFCIFTTNKRYPLQEYMNSKDNLIDIIIPCKNAEPYLKKCLQSIQDQTIKSWKCWIVDDHSTDKSQQMALSFEREDTRFKSLKNMGEGIIDALQTACKQINGQWITRMDADDVMAPDKLEKLSSLLLAHGEGNIACGKVHYFSKEGIGDGYQKYAQWINDTISSKEPYQEMYRECIIPSPSWMMWQSDFNKLGAFQNLQYPEDYDFAFKVYKAQFPIQATNDIVHYWRDYPNRTSRTDPNYADNRFLNLKVQHFLDIDYQSNQTLVLWGAGKKGKLIAKLLQASDINFMWITNNPKKVGLHIYDHLIQSDTTLPNNGQVIIAVAAPKELEWIDSRLKAKRNLRTFYFS